MIRTGVDRKTISSKRFLRATIVGSALVAAALGSAAAFGRSMNDDQKQPVKPDSVVEHAPVSVPGYWTKERMDGAKPYPMELGEPPAQPPPPTLESPGDAGTMPPGQPPNKR